MGKAARLRANKSKSSPIIMQFPRPPFKGVIRASRNHPVWAYDEKYSTSCALAKVAELFEAGPWGTQHEAAHILASCGQNSCRLGHWRNVVGFGVPDGTRGVISWSQMTAGNARLMGIDLPGIPDGDIIIIDIQIIHNIKDEGEQETHIFDPLASSGIHVNILQHQSDRFHGEHLNMGAIRRGGPPVAFYETAFNPARL